MAEAKLVIEAKGAPDDHLSGIADRTLHHFEETTVRVREALGERTPKPANVLVNLNAVNDVRAVEKVTENSASRQRELHTLLREPAVARIVTEDEDGTRRIYFVSRATPYRSPSDGSHAVSYNATPLGRLAALPVGGEIEAKIRGSLRTLTVIERALLHPEEDASGWDSRNSTVEGAALGPLTISSLRALLAQQSVDVSELDALDTALANDRAAALIVEGLQRDVIAKMELRNLAVLDAYQDEIFRLPLDTRLVIMGPPGTGKTTTLIKRLGQKLDWPNLSEDEQRTVRATAAGEARHETSWLMFTPTNLLEQYIEKAFARENIAAPADRIQTWDDFRRDAARNRFPILRSGSGTGQYVMPVQPIQSLLRDTIAAQRGWFEDFDQWQLAAYWEDMRLQGEVLAQSADKQTAQWGARALRALPVAGVRLSADPFLELAALSGDLNAQIARLKSSSDKDIRTSIAQEFKKDAKFLDELSAFVGSLQDVEEDDQEADDEDDAAPIKVGREAAVEALGRALRAKARGLVSGRTLGKKTRNGRLIEWFGERGPSNDELRVIGASLRVQTAARRFLNPVRQLMDGLPLRYRRFRRERQAEGRWYTRDGFGASELHPLEVDVILLAKLRLGRSLFEDRRVTRAGLDGMFSPLRAVVSLFRNQILVDEATDFSPVQLACMMALSDPASDSFVACGDFNQRITDWGSRSNDDLHWVTSDIEIRPVSVTYRHSRQLNELARAIAQISGPDVPEAHLPQRVNNDGFEPVLATGLQDPTAIAAWLRLRISEIERLTQSVPPIAVLVTSEDDVQPMANALNEILASGNLLAVACIGGQLAGQNNDIRVFDVQHIKGLEFEAVFFAGIDRLEARYPSLFERFLYVGATRAAMYLGMTTGASALPAKMSQLAGRFKKSWP